MFKTLVLIMSSAVTLQAFVIYDISNYTDFPMSVTSAIDQILLEPGNHKLHKINPAISEITIDSVHGKQRIPKEYFQFLISEDSDIPALEIYFDKSTKNFRYKKGIFKRKYA